MSQDPATNAALLNLCARAQRGSSGLDQEVRGLPAPGEGTPTPAPSAPRNPEDYQWLQHALATIESPERQVKRLLDVMEKADVSEDDLVATLEELSDLVEDINWATEFALMNGPARTMGVLRGACSSSTGTGESASQSAQSSSHPLVASSASVRAALAMVIAHAAQLNEQVQQCFAAAHWESVLVPLLEAEEDAVALAALLHACSCMCRDHPGNTLVFLQKGGLAALTSVLRRDDRNVKGGRVSIKTLSRACFFIAYLADTGVSTEEVIRLLCEHAEGGDDVGLQESVGAALLALARKSPSAVSKIALAAMPRRLQEWQALPDTEGERDVRAQLLAELSKKGG